MEYPKLREVQFFPVDLEGKRMGCLHDPQKISDKPLIIPWQFVTILPCLDGKHSLLDIQAEYMRNYGDLLFREKLIEFLDKLDHYLFLDSDRFHAFQDKIKQEFLSDPIRPAFFSGLCYSSDPKTLLTELEGYFSSPDGPGLQDTPKKNEKITGLIAPHIELSSGGPCFARAYFELAASSVLPELFIILGTCHAGVNGLFSLTGKSFQTPLGMAECDDNFLKLLNNEYKNNLYSEEFLHRSEHTIEFQILFLQFIWEKFGAKRPPFLICPILCALTPECLLEGHPKNEIYKAFIESLRKAITSYDKSICIIASVDLSHLGPKFGDPGPPDYHERESCFRKDREMLDMIRQQDQKGFQTHMAQEHDKRRICGYPPLTTMLDILPPSQGKLLNYNHAVVDDMGSIVTFAGMVFYGF
jgi:AmmeMemoRadiSam system protein B